MVVHKCPHCHYTADNKRALDRHLTKKFPCNEAPLKCDKCSRPFYNASAMYHHQKDCKGLSPTHEDKDKQIEILQNALSAVMGLNTEVAAKHQTNIQNQTNNNITVNDIKNITQNVVVLQCGNENIDHLKSLPFEELKKEIGFNRDPRTHIEAFKMIRLDPNHPENHNILLTDRDSDKVHFYANDKWIEGDYTYQIRNAIYDTNKQIQELMPRSQRNDEYYWDYLARGIGAFCNERNDVALKPIFDGVRGPLHQATMRLMKINPIDKSTPIHADGCGSIDAQTVLLIEKEKTRRLELEIELARVSQQTSSARQ